MRLQPLAYLAEVNGPRVLMNLNRVSSAEGDEGPALTRQVDEFALFASTATGPGLGRGNFGLLVKPKIPRKESAPQSAIGAREQLHGLGRGHRSGILDRRVENPRGLAGFDHSARGFRKHAPETGGFARDHIHGGGVTPDGGAVDPGYRIFDRKIVDQVSSLKVVRAIQNQGYASQQFVGVLGA